MKKPKKLKLLISALLIFSILISLVGCNKNNTVQDSIQRTSQEEVAKEVKETEEVEETEEEKESKYYVPELEEVLDAVDEMTREEVFARMNELRDPTGIGYLGFALYQSDLLEKGLFESADDLQLQKEGLKATIVSDKYGLHFSMPNPYTGEIYSELTVDDVEYFSHSIHTIRKDLSKLPLEERKHHPYRTYFDMIEEGREKELLSQFVFTWAHVNGYLILERGFQEGRFYIIPELVTQYDEDTYIAMGVVVNRWPEEPGGNLKEILGEKAGDGNFYKHPTSFIYTVTEEKFIVDEFIISVEDEYMKNLGPDYEHPPKAPYFMRFLFDRWMDGVEEGDLKY